MIWYVDMSETNSPNRDTRTRRHSVYNNSKSSILSSLRSKIKSADSKNGSDSFDPMNPGCIIQREQILLNKKVISIRKAYMVDAKYKVGWVVDSDISMCMLCFGSFGWFGLKHHCRACGLLVCGPCSPFTTVIPALEEESGSRVCRNCFGLKPGLVPTSPKTPSPVPNTISPYSASYNSAGSKGRNSIGPMSTPPNFDLSSTPSNVTSRRTLGSRLAADQDLINLSKQEQHLFQLEKNSEYKYEESYKIMRQMIPTDIFNISFDTLLNEYGVPEPVAQRIWSTKILWLIVMHPDDIAKIHLADFRSKYSSTGLDILEMRAIWFNLPHWKGSNSSSAVKGGSGHSAYNLKHGAQDENSGIMGSGSAQLEQGKYEWKQGFKARLDDMAYKESRGTLSAALVRNPAYEDNEDLYLFDYEVPLKTRFDTSVGYSASTTPTRDHEDGFSVNGRKQNQHHQPTGPTHSERTKAYTDNASRHNVNNIKKNVPFSGRKYDHYQRDNDDDDEGEGRGEDVYEDEDENGYSSEDEGEVEQYQPSVSSVSQMTPKHDVAGSYNRGYDQDDMSYRSAQSNKPKQSPSQSQSRKPVPAYNRSKSLNSAAITAALMTVNHSTPQKRTSLHSSNNNTRDRDTRSVTSSVNSAVPYDPLDDIYNYDKSKDSRNITPMSAGGSSSVNKFSKNTNSGGKNKRKPSIQQQYDDNDATRLSNDNLIRNSEHLRNLQQAASGGNIYEDDDDDYLDESQFLTQQPEHDVDEGSTYRSSITDSVNDTNSVTASLARQVAEQKAQLEQQRILHEQQQAHIELLRQQQLQMQQSHALNLNTNRVLSKFYQNQGATTPVQQIPPYNPHNPHQHSHQQQQQYPHNQFGGQFTPPHHSPMMQQQHPGSGGYMLPPSVYQQQHQQQQTPPHLQHQILHRANTMSGPSSGLYAQPAPLFHSISGSMGHSHGDFMNQQQLLQYQQHGNSLMPPPQQQQQYSLPRGHSDSTAGGGSSANTSAAAAMSLDTYNSGNSLLMNGNGGHPNHHHPTALATLSHEVHSNASGQTSPVRYSADSSIVSTGQMSHGQNHNNSAFFNQSQQQQQQAYQYNAGDITPPRRGTVVVTSTNDVDISSVTGRVIDAPHNLTPRSVLSQAHSHSGSDFSVPSMDHLENKFSSTSLEPLLEQNDMQSPYQQQSQYDKQDTISNVQQTSQVPQVFEVVETLVPVVPSSVSVTPLNTMNSLDVTPLVATPLVATPFTVTPVNVGDVSGQTSTAPTQGSLTPPRKKLVHSSSIKTTVSDGASGQSNHATSTPMNVPAAPTQSPLISPKLTSPKLAQQKTPQFNKTEVYTSLMSAVHSGNVKKAKQLLALIQKNNLDITISADEASELLLSCFSRQNIQQLLQPKDLIILLIDTFHGDVNTVDDTGRTVLHSILQTHCDMAGEVQASLKIKHRELASALINRGADILLNDNDGTSVLALSLSNNIEWILTEFETSGRENALCQSGDQLLLFKYTTSLILSGYAKRASHVISEGEVQISAEDATTLLTSCSGNFEAMKEPVETFELLESLGAAVA